MVLWVEECEEFFEMSRDILGEAKFWVANLRSSNTKNIVLELGETPDDEVLVGAYLAWWKAYTEGIRDAPSSRRSVGVSEIDVTKAKTAADEALSGWVKEATQ